MPEHAVASKITYRLFMGFRPTHEIASALAASSLWNADNDIGAAALTTAANGGVSYIGIALPSQTPTIAELHAAEASLRDALQRYCPNVRTDNILLTLFAQALIS